MPEPRVRRPRARRRSSRAAARRAAPCRKPFPGASTPAGQPRNPPPGIAGASPVSEPGAARARHRVGAARTSHIATAAATRAGSTAAAWCSGCSRRTAGPCLAKSASSIWSARKWRPTRCGAGDLLFFDTSSGGASHVGIALDRESFVHAPSSNGVVRVERYTSSYWSRRYLGARRVE